MDQSQECKGFDIEQRDCAGYLISQSYMDCSGGEHIAANAGPLEHYYFGKQPVPTDSAKLSVVGMSKDEAHDPLWLRYLPVALIIY